MSTIELREKLRLLSREERQEMLSFLKELEEVEETCSSLPSGKLFFEEAMDYTFQNFDTALRKLAQ